ncbi:MAG TPA: hypothetical protein VI758_11305 [Bacteroidota bacterium]
MKMAKKSGIKKRYSGSNSTERPAKDADSHTDSSERVLAALKNLVHRISRLESHLGIPQDAAEEPQTGAISQEAAEESEDALETQVGENWFAKVGIVVLALGVIFLLTFPYQNLASYAPSAIGYVLVATLLALSRYWKDSFQQVSRYLLGGGLLLLYFTTMRLSYFGSNPTITNANVELGMLSFVVLLNLVVSIRRRSPYLVGLNLALGCLTALSGSQPLFLLFVVAAICAGSTYFAYRHRWTWILTLGTVLSYFTLLLWSMNNPVFGNPVRQVPLSQSSLFFILLYAAILSAGTLAPMKKEKEELAAIVNSFLNGFGSYLLFAFVSFTAVRQSFGGWQLAASGLYLILAVTYWTRAKSRYITFLYAMLGYVALSVAIVDAFAVPDVFVWLCWQSILVLSTAVWFRSRFIVVANFVIFLLVFVAYLSFAGTVGLISVSFGIVALLSARILNWQKDRLELKTEMMRNAYLASALFVLPYALYHVLPRGYVSVSWLCLALFYYLVSRLLKDNRKYRWMALLTTSLTVLYVFVIDLIGFDPSVRIISFFALGLSLLAVSMVYSRRRRKSQSRVGTH